LDLNKATNCLYLTFQLIFMRSFKNIKLRKHILGFSVLIW